MLFCDFMLPKYFGWKGLWDTRPKLKAWWAVVNADPEAARVIAEVRGFDCLVMTNLAPDLPK